MAGTDLNSVVLIGRLTRDVELRYLPTGNAVADMSIAVNRNKKEGEQWISEANFFDVSLFGKSAENLKQYLLRGTQIAVQGYLKQDRWEKDGQKFSKIRIVANNVELLGGKSNGSAGNGNYNGGNSYSANSFGASQSSGYQQKSPYGSNGVSSYGASDYGQVDGGFGGDNSDFPEDVPF